jgi:RNA polymerase sigma-70 factor (ECF subfamily)
LTDAGNARPGSGINASDLIQAVAWRRDRTAFATLFDYFAPRVKSYLLRCRMAPNVAEELAQETLLMVWRKADAFDPARASASAWIFAIARNQRIDAFRRQQRNLLQPDPSAEPDPPTQPDSALILSERDQRVRDALKCLPAEQARVIELSFFDEASHAAISQELNLPLGTVKSRVRLAMNRLREVLGDLA